MRSIFLSKLVRLQLLLAAFVVRSSCNAHYQPTKVTPVENEFPTVAYSSLSMPHGSPWCFGQKPTFWTVGHNWYPNPETPHCYDSKDGKWKTSVDDPSISTITTLDYEDANSRSNGWKKIDRHGCVALDVNWDNVVDIICTVGANWHKDYGYAELYLTNPHNGNTITKVLEHGLHRYPSMSQRWIVSLRGPNDSRLVFISTSGVVRKDGLPNLHRMYRVLRQEETPDTDPVTNLTYNYFTEVTNGPWSNYHFPINNEPVVADINQDGLDDLIVFSWSNQTHIYIQHNDGSWEELDIQSSSSNDLVSYWQDARVGYISSTDQPDLVVSWGIYVGIQQYYLHVFKGISEPPYFDFHKPYYSTRIGGTAGIGIEILDMNHDNLADVYVSTQAYDGCNKDNTQVPPIDRWRDLLLVGVGNVGPNNKPSFQTVQMNHKLRGCGGMVKKFGNPHTLLLAEGSHHHIGYQYLLEWDTANTNTTTE